MERSRKFFLVIYKKKKKLLRIHRCCGSGRERTIENAAAASARQRFFDRVLRGPTRIYENLQSRLDFEKRLRKIVRTRWRTDNERKVHQRRRLPRGVNVKKKNSRDDCAPFTLPLFGRLRTDFSKTYLSLFFLYVYIYIHLRILFSMAL